MNICIFLWVFFSNLNTFNKIYISAELWQLFRKKFEFTFVRSSEHFCKLQCWDGDDKRQFVYCIGRRQNKWYDCELGRFLDTDLAMDIEHCQCYEKLLLKRLKSNDKTSSLQFDLCSQSKLNQYWWLT